MKNKLLLIIPPCFISRAIDFEIGFPVHLSVLGHTAREQGWDVEFLDMTLEEKEGHESFAELDRRLEDGDINLVGVSNHTVRTSVTTRIVAERVKLLRPDVPVVAGGVNATFMWHELMQWCPEIDYVLRGYAQPGLRALLHALEVKSKTLSAPGLVQRRGGELETEPMVSITPADLTFPLPGGLDVARYTEWTRTYPLLTHTGCGFSCNFCTSVMPGPYQNKEVHRPPDEIVAEMKRAVELGFDRFFMSANIFTSRRERCLELCDAIQRAGLPDRATWVCMTRVELVDEEMLDVMAAAGCINIAFGVESVGGDQWKNLNKGRYSEQTVHRAFHLTKEAGIGTTSYLMLGTPEQTPTDVEATVDAVRELNPDYRVVSFFQPFPGTPYWTNADHYGLSETAPLEEWNFHEAPICRTRHFDKPSLVDAAIRLYLDRGDSMKVTPSVHALEMTNSAHEISGDMPLPVQHAVSMINNSNTIAEVLEQVTASHAARGRLIALYWLSAGLRDGSLKVVEAHKANAVQPINTALHGALTG